MAKKFQFDNPKYNDYTVEQLLNLTNEDLNNMTRRDISRVTRTVSLAANKRLNRLLQYSEKQGDEYVPKKGSKTKILPYALNNMLDDYKRRNKTSEGRIEKFSAGKDLSKNQLRTEFNRARRFMNMQTSTIKGSVDVRKSRERRATGYTQEDYINKRIKEGIGADDAAEEFDALEKKVFKRFRKYNEYRAMGGDIPRNYMGSDEVLAMVRNRTLEGRRITNKKLAGIEEEGYIAEQEARDNELQEDLTLETGGFTEDDLPFEVDIDDDEDYWT